MKVHNYREVSPEESPEAVGASLRWVISEKEGALTFAMRVAELQQGAATPSHSHAWEHEVFVLSGEGRVASGGEEFSLQEGDAAFIPPMEEHHFANAGTATFRFICAIPLTGTH
jgi:quercetin dioxygenase-like cupin family protein